MTTGSSPAEIFERENGMTPEEAWQKVAEWHLAGKKEEAKRGAEIIVQYFPEHPAKTFLEKLDQAETETSKKGTKKSAAEKMGGKFADSVEEFLKKHTTKNHTAPAETATPPSASPEALPKAEAADQTSIPDQPPVLDEERVFATISYAWLLFLIPLLLKKESQFVQFHAKQGAVMAVAITIYEFTIGSLLNLISGGVAFAIKAVYICFLVYAGYQAYQGKYWRIPVVSSIAEKIKL